MWAYSFNSRKNKMNLYFDTNLAQCYHSSAQKARVLTEAWLKNNMYCPSCGNESFSKFENNSPVADVYCSNCLEEYELKSKIGQTMGNSISDGAYHTMLERIHSSTNPNFFFLSYCKREFKVQELILIPKHFFTADIIIPRKKGLKNRPNYIMCSIDTKTLPESAKIQIISQQKPIEKSIIIKQWKQHLFIRQYSTEHKGWLFAIMQCLDRIPSQDFSLKDVYFFETELSKLFPNNHNIKAKIRQQLQILRNQGIIEFSRRGYYHKL